MSDSNPENGMGKETAVRVPARVSGDLGNGGARTQDGREATNFINDIEPFLFDRAITYVDVGANVGAVLDAIQESSISVRQAHLIEPNPTTFVALEQSAQRFSKVKQLSCHNIAVGAEAGMVAMRDEGTMTHIISRVQGKNKRVADRTFEVEAVTLDELAQQCEIRHIDLLKIDVEGHELAVFEGAQGLLEPQSVDVIYVEAGLDSSSSHQTYYRAIEDKLNIWGYHIFRIYEQKNEWMEDSPLLRRVNLAFMSTHFASQNPYKVTRKLFDARSRERKLATEMKSLQQKSAALQNDCETLLQDIANRDTALAETRRQLEKLRADHDTALAETSRQLEKLRADRDVLLESHNAAKSDLEKFRNEYAEDIAKRDTALAETRRRLQEKTEALVVESKEVQTRFEEIAVLTKMLEELHEYRDALLNSTSWKLTAPMRKIINKMRAARG